VGQLWDDAFVESNYFEHKNGLAPRLMKVALVNGPVLHIMSALEKAVQFHSEKDKALKIMRARVGGRRIVGIRFPLDERAYQTLQEELEKIQKARCDTGSSYIDEDLAPVCLKSEKWATEERKTMKSFFQVKSPPSTHWSSGKNTVTAGPSNKRSSCLNKPSAAASTVPRKKPNTMFSYFSKKN
jgi:hypothetical protein